MDWPALRRFADAIGPEGRNRLLRILEASEKIARRPSAGCTSGMMASCSRSS
jgi:hypothetical protein